MRVIPSVKSCRAAGGELSLGRELRVAAPREYADRIGFVLSELLPWARFALLDGESNVRFSRRENADSSEYYALRSVGEGVEIVFYDFLGARNAVATLAQLVSLRGGELVIPRVEIEDYPDADFRSFMHDVGRKYIPLEELKLHVLMLAKFKMNVLHFHFSEYVGFAVALEGFSGLRGPGERQYTEDEIRELVAYANALGVDVIPEIDIPGHANAITYAYPETACKREDGEESSGWAMCVGSEETYALLERMIRRVSELFGSKYFHIGTDEISMTDLDREPKPVADWLLCAKCRQLMARENISDEVGLFYYFLRRIYSIVKSLGKQLIMWNDWIDISASPDIPRDIIIEFWRVAAPDRGPHIGCSMQRFLDEGFTVVNAHYPDTYIDLYVDYGRLKDWRYDRSPAADENTVGKIIGGDVPAWDVHEHYRQSIPVAIPLFADKLWERRTEWGRDFLPAVSECLFGTGDFSVFDYTRDVVMLDDENNIWRDGIDRAQLRESLVGIIPRDPVQAYCKETYLRLLE